MVKVEVESYGVPELFTPVMVSNEIGKTKAKFVFESQEMAQSYELGYKKVGDEEYKTVESDTPEFEMDVQSLTDSISHLRTTLKIVKSMNKLNTQLALTDLLNATQQNIESEIDKLTQELIKLQNED